jgi:predicted RNase H-like HicB family nuclease
MKVREPMAGIGMPALQCGRRAISYLVIVEKGDASFGAYVPDLPGCATVGETEEEAVRLIREAIALHLEALKEQGLPIPEPRSHAQLVAAGR